MKRVVMVFVMLAVGWLLASTPPAHAANLTTTLAAPPAPTALLPGIPFDGDFVIANLIPTLGWTNVGADSYAVAISKSPYGTANIIYNPQTVVGTSITVPAGVLESGTRYRWNLQARDASGLSPVSNTLYFQTPAVDARIDSYSPSSRQEVQVGQSVILSVTFTNTGGLPWRFVAGATVWDSAPGTPNRQVVANYEFTLAADLQPGGQWTAAWSHPVNAPGDYWVQFGVWTQKPFISGNLLDKEPDPSQNLFSGVAPPPSAPSNLIASGISTTQILITWSDNSSDESDFHIERSSNGTNWSALATTGANFFVYTDAGLNCNSTFFYRVRAHRHSDNTFSAYSNTDDGTTNPCPLTAPTNLIASGISTTQILITWSDNSSDESDFHIERSSNGTNWSALATTGANFFVYTDAGLSCNSTFFYRVRAHRHGDNTFSAYSNTDDGTTNACPSAAPSPVITSSLTMEPALPYGVGQTLTARFTIANQGDAPITFTRLTAGGRLNGVNDCSNTGFVCPDFTHALNIMLNPGNSYNYQGTFTPSQPGNYDFQVFYCLGLCDLNDGLPDDWHFNVPTAIGISNSALITVSSAPVGRNIGDRPDDISGSQVHVMYVLPSDGTDRELDVDGTIATSVAAFQKWLEGQTGGQRVRMDEYQGALDITFFRLNQTDAEMRNNGKFVRNQIESQLHNAGFNEPNKIYAVYYDGGHDFNCGDGVWPPTVPGNAVALYLHGTPPAPPGGQVPPPCNTNLFATSEDTPGYWEYSMIHELVHGMGFVKSCAPHHIYVDPPNNGGGHVSDSPQDLMAGPPISWPGQPAVLDVGKDDYFGNPPQTCPDSDLGQSPFLTPLPAPTNQPPSADSGPDQTVLVGDTVQLDGSGSSDPDGDPLVSYNWQIVSKPSGSVAVISDPAVVNPTFVADVAGDYVLQLVVNDGAVDSAPDQVTVTASSDSDGDALLDVWETRGIDNDGDGKGDGPNDTNLPAMGADPNKKDIFVEIDWMKRTGLFAHSHQPNPLAIAKIVDAFSKAPVDCDALGQNCKGINLHVDVGSDSIDYVTGNKWGNFAEGNVLPHDLLLGSILDLDALDNDLEAIINGKDAMGNPNFEAARQRAFHHVIFAHQIARPDLLICAAGIAGLQYSVVALGGWPNCPFNQVGVGSVNEQAGVFMHELGHNLGLCHGGPMPPNSNTTDCKKAPDPQVEINKKPNYLSVMNYSFAYSGLIINQQEGHFDYSRFSDLPDLNEGALSEPDGLNTGQQPVGLDGAKIDHYGTKHHCAPLTFRGGPLGESKVALNVNGQINWDCDLGIDLSPVKADVNDDRKDDGTLTSFNDWENLNYKGQTIGLLTGPFPPIALTFEDSPVELTEDQQFQIQRISEPRVHLSKTATPNSVTSGKVVTYEVTMLNTDAGDAEGVAITDTLPAGFGYQPGSTGGATTENPIINGQQLTWAGPFIVPAESSLVLSFRAIAANTPGMYFNSVSGNSTNGIVIPTSDTALVTVEGPRDLKEGSIATLDALINQGQFSHIDGFLVVRNQIQASLDPEFWLDDTHLVERLGSVGLFELERSAVLELGVVLRFRAEELPDDVKSSLHLVIDDLVKADRILASIKIQETEAAPTLDPENQGEVDERLALANQRLAEGDAARDAGDPAQAIAFYSGAWEHAFRAMEAKNQSPEADDGGEGDDVSEGDGEGEEDGVSEGDGGSEGGDVIEGEDEGGTT